MNAVRFDVARIQLFELGKGLHFDVVITFLSILFGASKDSFDLVEPSRSYGSM